jgi:hypothetical protein
MKLQYTVICKLPENISQFAHFIYPTTEWLHLGLRSQYGEEI